MHMTYLLCIILIVVIFVRIEAIYPIIPIIPDNDPTSYSYLDRVLIDGGDGYSYINLNVEHSVTLYLRSLTKDNAPPQSDIQLLFSFFNYLVAAVTLEKSIYKTRTGRTGIWKCWDGRCITNTCENTKFNKTDSFAVLTSFTIQNFYNHACASTQSTAALKMQTTNLYGYIRFHNEIPRNPQMQRVKFEIFQAYDYSFPLPRPPRGTKVIRYFNTDNDLPNHYRQFLQLDHESIDLKTARFDVKRLLLNTKFEFITDELPHSPLFVFDDAECEEFHLEFKFYFASFTQWCFLNVKRTKTEYQIYAKENEKARFAIQYSFYPLKFQIEESKLNVYYGFALNKELTVCPGQVQSNLIAFEITKREIKEQSCPENVHFILRYRVYMVETEVTDDDYTEPPLMTTTTAIEFEEEPVVAAASTISKPRKHPLWLLLILVFVILCLIVGTLIFWACIPGTFISKYASKVPVLRRFYEKEQKPRILMPGDIDSQEKIPNPENGLPANKANSKPTAESANKDGSANSPGQPNGEVVVMQHTTKTSRTTESVPETPTIMGKAFSSRHRRWSNFYEKKPDFVAAMQSDFSKIEKKLLLADHLYQILPIAKYTESKVAAEQEDWMEPNSRVYFYLRNAMTEEHGIFSKFAVRLAEPFSNNDIPATIRERDPSSLRKTPFYVMKLYILSKDPPGFEVHYRGQCPYFLQSLACENCDTVVPQFGRAKIHDVSMHAKDMPAGYHYHVSICLGEDDNDLSKYVNVFVYRAHRKLQEIKTGVQDVLHINNINLEPLHARGAEKYSAELKRIEVPEGGKQVKVVVDRVDPMPHPAQPPMATVPSKGATDKTQATATQEEKKKSDEKVENEKKKKSLDKTQGTETADKKS